MAEIYTRARALLALTGGPTLVRLRPLSELLRTYFESALSTLTGDESAAFAAMHGPNHPQTCYTSRRNLHDAHGEPCITLA